MHEQSSCDCAALHRSSGGVIRNHTQAKVIICRNMARFSEYTRSQSPFALNPFEASEDRERNPGCPRSATLVILHNFTHFGRFKVILPNFPILVRFVKHEKRVKNASRMHVVFLWGCAGSVGFESVRSIICTEFVAGHAQVKSTF